jgi:hypothetical protein
VKWALKMGGIKIKKKNGTGNFFYDGGRKKGK